MFELRRAEEKDCENIFLLSNDKEVRQVSINQKQIAYSEHRKWFSDILQNENILFLVAYVDDALMAQVRFRKKAEAAEISISVSADFRGKGFASQVLKSSLMLARDQLHVDKVIATVRKENSRSAKFFKNCGFSLTGEETEMGRTCQFFEYIFTESSANE